MDQKILTILLTIFIVVNIGLIVGVILNKSKPRCETKYKTETRIVGGKKVPIQAHPFMAGIVIKRLGYMDTDMLQCGCSIVSSKWVVTAAHCLLLIFEQNFSKNMVYISSNSAKWSKGKKHDILNWVYHENYDDSLMSNDIALIRVKQPFTGSNERTVAIANRHYPYKPDTTVNVTGWGLLHDYGTDIQDELNGVEVKLFKQSDCTHLYGERGDTVTDEMFCAGYLEGGKDACQFDSGGPIFDRNLLIGIVSWGIDCAHKNQPGVYTRISLYEKWIIATTKKLKDPIHARFRNKP